MFNFDLTNTPESFKGALLNLFTIPFWYVTLYLFKTEFFFRSDFFLIISFCLCLAVLSSFCIGLIMTIDDDKKLPVFNPLSASIGVLVQVVILSVLILIFYLIKRYTILNPDLLFFLGSYFFLLILLAINQYFELKNRKSNESKRRS